uniref:Uncharacterized protein n=1 Tax=Manihot esculenta TaxID=3983 RepID=A0A2C9VE79_MANES
MQENPNNTTCKTQAILAASHGTTCWKISLRCRLLHDLSLSSSMDFLLSLSHLLFTFSFFINHSFKSILLLFFPSNDMQRQRENSQFLQTWNNNSLSSCPISYLLYIQLVSLQEKALGILNLCDYKSKLRNGQENA